MKLLFTLFLSVISVACFSQKQVKDTLRNDTLFVNPYKYKFIKIGDKVYKVDFTIIQIEGRDIINGWTEPYPSKIRWLPASGGFL